MVMTVILKMNVEKNWINWTTFATSATNLYTSTSSLISKRDMYTKMALKRATMNVLISDLVLTADRLAQLVEYRTTVMGSNPSQTTTQGL